MKNFAKVENGTVTEVIEAEYAPDDTYIECRHGIRGMFPYPEYKYDYDLDIFYMPAMDE